MAKVIKEIIIMLLVCLLSMLVFAIVLYKYIPNRKNVPEVAKYTVPEDVKDLLEDNVDSQTSSGNVILTYNNQNQLSVTESELKGYQSTNTYVPGKANPFAAASSSTTTDDSGSNANSNNTGSSSDSSNSSGTQNNEQTNPNNKEESTAPSIYNSNGTK